MNRTDRVFVAGASGLVGSSLVRALNEQGFVHVLTSKSSDVDLRRQAQVESYFENEKPEYVFVAAAKVGGILANNTYPAEFIYDNIMIEANLIHCAYRFNVKKLLFLGSTCIYPKFAPQPLKEEYLLTGELEPTNEPYAVAKIAGIKLCDAYRRQYGANFVSVMPTNLYGPNDNFSLENSHVLPALIRKFHEAKINHSTNVTVWGSGMPRREFLFVDDLAEACLFLMNHYNESEFINVGTGQDLAISELVHMISNIVGFEGQIIYDQSKPDGTPQKLSDITKINKLGWKAKTPLEEGLRRTYDWYVKSLAVN